MTNDENQSYPGYIVGSLVLPPRAIKDAESVGMCAQIFTVVKGQGGSIEIAFGDPDQEGPVWEPESAERFLLSVGDNFLIPPGNSYRIQNHSKTTEALLSWTIVRHNHGHGLWIGYVDRELFISFDVVLLITYIILVLCHYLHTSNSINAKQSVV
jgi:hypothetical protein